MQLGADESAYRPGSVIGTLRSRRATIHLRLPLPTASSGLPAGSGGPPSNACAAPSNRSPTTPFDLAPGGVYRAARVTSRAGGLLHHRFTLTSPDADANRRPRKRSVFCGTVPRVTPGGRYPPPCPVEPGPSSARTRRCATRSPGRLVRRSSNCRRSGCREEQRAGQRVGLRDPDVDAFAQ